VLYLNRRDRAEPEKIEARAFLEQFAADFCANEKVPPESVQVEVRTTLRMSFDRQHLHQVLWNLLRNAWRHGLKLRESVHVTLWDADEPGWLSLEVVDDGPGVAAELQPHLFEPFFTTEAQGTGLGLYIARELCEGNGARIEYRDDGTGCRFRITLRGT